MTHTTDSTRPAAKGQSLASATALITLVILASRLVGFGRWLAQARFLGTGGIDVPFNSANMLPNILFEVVAGGALIGVIVPLVATPLGKENKAQANQSASAIFTWALAILLPVGLLTMLLAGPISGALGLSGLNRDIAAMFLRVFALQIPLYGVAVVLQGILQAHKRFFWPVFVPLISSILVIITFGIFAHFAATATADISTALPPAVALSQIPNYAIWLLAWGATIGVSLLALPLIIPVKRTGIKLRPTFHFPAGEGKRAAQLAFAGIGALVAQQLSVLLIMRLANTDTGVWTVYLYTQQVYLLPFSLLALPLATSAFPHLAAKAAPEYREEFNDLVASTTRTIALTSAIGVAALIAAAPFVQEVFNQIATGVGVPGMATGLIWMAPGLFGWALITHLSRVLYTVDAGKAAVKATALGWAIVALLIAIGSLMVPLIIGPREAIWLPETTWPPMMGWIGGATSVGMTVAGIGLLWAIRNKLGAAALKGVPLAFGVVLGAAAIGGFVSLNIAPIIIRTFTANLGPMVGNLFAGLLAGLLAAIITALISLADPQLRASLRALRTSLTKRLTNR